METERFEKTFFIGLVVLAVVLAAIIFLPELDVLVLAGTLGALFYPLYGWLKNRMPKYGGLAAGIVLLVVIAIIVVPFSLFAARIFGEAAAAYGSLAAGTSSGTGFSSSLLLGAEHLDALKHILSSYNVNVEQGITQILNAIMGSASALLAGFWRAAWTLLIALIALYYLLKDGARLRAAIVRGMPMPDADAEIIMGKFEAIVVSVVRVTIVMSCAYGIAVGLDFLVFGLDNPALWGGAALFASFIPLVGVYFITVPAAIFLALTGHPIAAIGVLVFISVCGFLFENFLRPLLLHRGTNVHPLLILVSILGGFAVVGPIGMLVGPIILSFLVALIEIAPVFMGKKGTASA